MRNGPVYYAELPTCQGFHNCDYFLQSIYFVHVSLFKIFFQQMTNFQPVILQVPLRISTVSSATVHGHVKSSSREKNIPLACVFLSNSPPAPLPPQPRPSSQWSVLIGMPALFLVAANRCLSSAPEGKVPARGNMTCSPPNPSPLLRPRS